MFAHNLLHDELVSCDSLRSALPPAAPETTRVVEQLQDRIRRVETSQRVSAGEMVSSGCSAIDALLPAGGYSRGTLVQWLTPGGYGVDWMSWLVAREACRAGGALVVADPEHQFHPPAAAALGIDLANLVVLQRDSDRTDRPSAGNGDEDLLWAIDQALKCPAVGAVWAPLAAVDERWFRRFQLSAESSGCLGLLVQPCSQARQPSWAEVQWLVGRPRTSTVSRQERAGESDPGQRLRLQLTRCRGAQTGRAVELVIDAVTGTVARDTRFRTTAAPPTATSADRQPGEVRYG